MNPIDMVGNFFEERKKWKEAGAPIRSPEKMLEIFNICSSNQCEQYIKISDTHGQCGICKCHLKVSSHILNKIAYATTRCPHETPYWVEEPEYLQQIEEVVQEEIKEAAPEEPPKPKVIDKGCGCGG